jgi:hypothetical protein
MQRIFGLTANTPTGYLNDAANVSNSSGGLTGSSQAGNSFTAAASPTGGFGTSTAQDMSDLFQSGVVPAQIPGLNYTAGGYAFNRRTGTYTQSVTVTNTLSTAYTDPVYLVVRNLSSNSMLQNSAGTTTNSYAGSPYVLVSQSGLAAGASTTVTLQYGSTGTITDTLAVIHTSGQP